MLSRHFLGSLAKDAIGFETVIKAEMGGEFFSLTGLLIEQYNYLEVYTFEKWSEKSVPQFQENERFKPEVIM